MDFALDEPLDPTVTGALLDAAGQAKFSDELLRAARRFDAVEEVFAYRVCGSGAPEAVLFSSVLEDTGRRGALYTRYFHRHDPVTVARQSVQIGRGFANRIQASDIGLPDYRSLCFEKPRFIDKLCFGWKADAHALVLSFYRSGRQGGGAEGRLAALADVALMVMDRHARSQGPADPVALLEGRLAQAYPGLTRRERQICARSLAGWTSGQIAHALQIGVSTVLTYRQRAYQRFGYSQASDFLPRLLA